MAFTGLGANDWGVKRAPETPALANAGEFTGHLWIQELPTGGWVRFQITASGLVRFGLEARTFERVETVPLPYRRAAETVHARLDRQAVQTATDDPTQVTFCGLATRNEGLDYDWAALPPFVGVDIWSGTQDSFVPPDTATRVFDQLNLATLPAVEKELPAAHTTLDQYRDDAAVPPSAWRDGPAAGLLIRDKTGGRAHVWRSSVSDTDGDTEPTTATPTDLAARYATDDRIRQTIATLRESDHSPTIDAIQNRLVADLIREEYATLCPGDEFVASVSAFESAVAERVQQYRHESTQ